MLVTADSIIKLAGVIVALATILGAIISFIKWYLKLNAQAKALEDLKKNTEEETSCIKKEQAVICYALLACLDGLHQLGANGNVTKAHESLEKHLNLSAHE